MDFNLSFAMKNNNTILSYYTSYFSSNEFIRYGNKSADDRYIIPPPTIIKKILTIHSQVVSFGKKSFLPLQLSVMSVFLAMINTPLNEMHTPTTNNTIYNKIIKFPPTRIGLPKINK